MYNCFGDNPKFWPKQYLIRCTMNMMILPWDFPLWTTKVSTVIISN